MPELDIHASAREVVDLLECNQNRRAIDRLDALREGQPLVVQEALDRYIATRAREQLTALAAPGALTARDAGVAGPVLERLRGATGAPRFPDDGETAPLSQAQLHDVYGSIAESRGNQAARDSLEANNERVILGMRRETETTFDHGIGDYNHRLVVMWKDDDGTRHAREFNRANTEPSAQYDHHAGSDGTLRYADGGNASRLERSPGYEDVSRRKIEGEDVNRDVNRDGVRDLGRLGEGSMEMRATTHPRYSGGRQNGTEFALRPSPEAILEGVGRVQRDTNADGWFTAADVNGVQDLNDTFKIHRGSSGRNTDSAGCQTISGTQYDDFIAEVRRNPLQDRWQYVLTSVDTSQQPQQGLQLQNRGQPGPEAAPGHPIPPPHRPADPQHPDHGLHTQIQDRVGALGLPDTQNNEQLSMSLLAEAKAQGLWQVDHLFPNRATTDLKSGERLFMVQGSPTDPAATRAMLGITAAANTPIEESVSRIEAINRAATNRPAIDLQHRDTTQDAPSIRLS